VNRNCQEGSVEGSRDELADISVEAPGEHSLRVWLEDAAGNQRRPPDYDAVRLRYDPIAPELAFEPQGAADPLRVAVRVTDEHSGLAGGEIEMRRVGTATWHLLATTVEASRLIAEVDDERFRNGSYEFRARALDAAGNEASTSRRIDGSMAGLRLPVRIPTRLRVGLPHVVTRRVTVRRHGQRRVVRRRRVVLRPKARVRFGRQVTLRGSIRNPDGHPIEHATIGVFDLVRDGRTLEPLGLAQADGNGRFRYVARANRTRRLRFYYRGSTRIHSATRDVQLEVPAQSTIRVDRSRALNGQGVTFSGQVRTRPLPLAGKLIEVQAFFRNRWRTFSTTRADRRGRWRFRYRFGGTAGRVVYRFRVRLPREGGYPFATGHSSVIPVTVIGP
jgi:hypothetical protein